MPFKSEKQRRYLWANEPEVARKWANEYSQGGRVSGKDYVARYSQGGSVDRDKESRDRAFRQQDTIQRLKEYGINRIKDPGWGMSLYNNLDTLVEAGDWIIGKLPFTQSLGYDSSQDRGFFDERIKKSHDSRTQYVLKAIQALMDSGLSKEEAIQRATEYFEDTKTLTDFTADPLNLAGIGIAKGIGHVFKELSKVMTKTQLDDFTEIVTRMELTPNEIKTTADVFLGKTDLNKLSPDARRVYEGVATDLRNFEKQGGTIVETPPYGHGGNPRVTTKPPTIEEVEASQYSDQPALIHIPPIKDEKDLAIAAHELGHATSPRGVMLPGFGGKSPEILNEERMAATMGGRLIEDTKLGEDAANKAARDRVHPSEDLPFYEKLLKHSESTYKFRRNPDGTYVYLPSKQDGEFPQRYALGGAVRHTIEAVANWIKKRSNPNVNAVEATTPEPKQFKSIFDRLDEPQDIGWNYRGKPADEFSRDMDEVHNLNDKLQGLTDAEMEDVIASGAVKPTTQMLGREAGVIEEFIRDPKLSNYDDETRLVEGIKNYIIAGGPEQSQQRFVNAQQYAYTLIDESGPLSKSDVMAKFTRAYEAAWNELDEIYGKLPH